MVERARRGKSKHKSKQDLLGNHQRCWLWGRVLVSETLRAGRWPILELFLADDLPADQMREATERAKTLGVAVKIESRDALTQRCRTEEHQRYVAQMSSFPYAALEDVLAAKPARPLYVILDAMQDPYNFGAVLRSAEVFGADAVFIGKRRQTPVSSMVARSSAGAINRVPIVQVPDLPKLVKTLQGLGVTVVGTSEHAEHKSWDGQFQRPTAIIIGNEGAGIGSELLARCDNLVCIPQHGEIGSLNAAAAAAVLLYEVRRQQEGSGASD